jgi:hypothetical protein
LYTTEADVVKDLAGNGLPVVPEFIVRNLVPRVRQPEENTLGAEGLWIDHTKIELSDVSESNVFDKAVSYIQTTLSPKPNNAVMTIILEHDQTYAGSSTIFSTTPFPATNVTTNKISNTLIITTTSSTPKTITITGTNQALIGRNGLTIIIDKNIIIKRQSGVAAVQSLIVINDGGKLILDGGEIRDSHVTAPADNAGGGVRIGGGTNGAYFIMNSGKITGNSVEPTSDSSSRTYAGGLAIVQMGMFVMHGGEISNNTFRTTTWAAPKGGGINGVTTSASARHANAGIYMTGGSIDGNTVEGSGSYGSAGGVYTSGSFQKTGGTISNNVNSATGGNIKPRGVGVIKVGDLNPSVSNAIVRDNDAESSISLFVYSIKTAASAVGTLSVPTWGPDNWDK